MKPFSETSIYGQIAKILDIDTTTMICAAAAANDDGLTIQSYANPEVAAVMLVRCGYLPGTEPVWVANW